VVTTFWPSREVASAAKVRSGGSATQIGDKVAIVNKDELARGMAARSGLDNGQAKAALDAALEEIAKQIGNSNEVRLTGFGKFSAVQRAAREGRNPRTGESMQIAAKRVPKFTAGAELKKAVE
jgi:DNA-binding protein HU-beta